MRLFTKIVASPVGALTLVGGDAGLSAIVWENDRVGRVTLGAVTEDGAHPVLRRVEAQLADYFAGRRTVFDVPLAMVGTDFQKQVWDALRTIPFGETRSYGALATQIGNPKASRAVGAANGRNPISIIVPCHRAIGASGALTGFSGGLEAKRILLAIEDRQGGLWRKSA